MARSTQYRPDDELEALVVGALEGSELAWNALVERLQRVVWKAVNMLTREHEVRNDAFAATWLRLAERLHTIREPAKLPGWLATTAANEVRQIVRRRYRDDVSLTDESGEGRGHLDRLVGDDGDYAAPLAAGVEHAEVRNAFAALDATCRDVVTVLVLADPPLAYDEASEMLGRPIGSLGPTRRRCLDKLTTLLHDHQENSP